MKTLKDKDFNLIEDFISGNLSPDEDKKFRERLDTETNLANAYRFRTKIAYYWNEVESYETTNEHVKELLKQERNRKKKYVAYFYAAASIVILIGSSIFFFRQPKEGSSDNRLTLSYKDTSTESFLPLSINKQPEKGTLFVVPPEYTVLDTIIILRTKDFHDKEKILIRRTTDSTIVKEFILEMYKDILHIPLNELQPGNYYWIIDGSSFSGSFIIKERLEIKKQL